MTDDSEIIQAAQRLIARTQWRALLDSDFYPRIIVARDGRIAMLNELALQLFDYPEPLILGHLVEEFMPERFRKKHVEYRTKFFDHPVRRSMGSNIDLAILTRYGTEVPVDLGLAPLRVEEGTLVSITLQRKADRSIHGGTSIAAGGEAGGTPKGCGRHAAEAGPSH